MSWSELERLVDEAEANPSLRRSLKGCRSTPELILAARRLGYRITRMDLQRAWEEERWEYQREAQGCIANHQARACLFDTTRDSCERFGYANVASNPDKVYNTLVLNGWS